MATLTFTGTGGVWEGSAGAADVVINQDAVLDLNGTSDYISIPDDSSYKDHWAGGGTLSLWFKPSVTSVNSQRICDKDLWKLRLRNVSGSYTGLELVREWSGGDATWNTTATIRLGDWSHIAIVYDDDLPANDPIFYHNGQAMTLSTDTNTSGTCGTGSTSMNIGARFDGASGFMGMLPADVRIYDASLSQPNIAILASKINVDTALGAGTTNLKLHLPLVLKDSTATVNETIDADEVDNNIAVSSDDTFTNGEYLLIDDEILGPISNVDGSDEFDIPDAPGGRGLFGTAAAGHSTGDNIYIVRFADESGEDNHPTLVGDLITPSGDLVFDAFSVNIQDTATTTGTTTVTQGKLECLSLSSISFDGTDDVVKSSGTTDIMNDKDATLSFWYKGGSPGTAKTILESNGSYNQALLYSRNGNEIRLYTTTGATNEFGLDATQVTASGLYNGAWHHMVWVLDNGGQSHVIYVDGVSYPITFISVNNHTVDWNGISVGGEYADLTGSMRDIRFYDYHLSADQAASLYSGSYNVTPLWNWKLDEGTGNVSNSGSNGTTEDLTVTNATWVNGALTLTGATSIATTGTLSAPRGNLDLGVPGSSNVLTRAGSGVYTHNNGKMRHTTANTGTLSGTFTGLNAFYDIEVSNGGGNLSIDGGDIDIEHDTTGGPGNIKIYDNCTVTAGTDSHSCEWTNDTTFGMSSGLSGTYPRQTLQAKNQLKPINYNPASGTTYWGEASLDDCIGDGRYFAVKWINWKQALVIPYNAKLTLIGDCTFENTVTINDDSTNVSGGDDGDGGGDHALGQLDLNGHRMEASNILTNNGSFYMDGTLVFTGAGYLDDNGDFFNPGDCTLMQMGTSTATMDLPNTNVIGTVFYNQPSVTMDHPTSGRMGINHIIGAGTWNYTSGTPSTTNLTIAAGATLGMGSCVTSLAGDFTTSGGLIGNSGMVCAGANDYEGCRPGSSTSNGGGAWEIKDDWNFTSSNGITVEGWVKFDDFDFGDSGANTDAVLFGMVRGGGTGDSYGCGIQINDDNLMMIFGSADTTWRTVGNGAIAVSDVCTIGKWHHLAATCDANDSSTPVGKLYVDGKLVAQHTGASAVYFSYQFVIGGHAYSTDGGFTNRIFDGTIARCSAWNVELTQAQIRQMMFEDYDDAVASSTPHGNARGWWQFDEGTGVIVDNKGVGGATYDATVSLTGTTWAVAGAFDHGSASTLDMSGTGTINFIDDEHLYNLTTSGTTTLKGITDTSDLRLNGVLNASGTLSSTASETIMLLTGSTVGIGTAGTSIQNLFKLRCRPASGTVSIPECTTKTISCETSGATTQATGDLTITTKLNTSNSHIFNANGNIINVKDVECVETSTLDLRDNSTLQFKVNSTSSLSLASTSTLRTSGTTIEGYSSTNHTPFTTPAAGNFELVGDMKWMDIQDSDGDITVIGTTFGCGFEEIGGNIRQWHHTLDTQQLLDADEDDDDDIKLPRPSLDNSLELETGG